ncbi:SETMR methyltransferase, partial [Acromyrmex charruanus]
MEINKEKIRILQYYYDKGKNAAQACEKICAIYGEDTLSKSAARKWFARFRTGNFDVKDEPRSGRPEIMEKVERDKHVSIVEITKELGIDHKTILNHLHKVGYKKKLDVWIPHTSLITRQKLRELGWEVLMHPSYSPDIAPSNYHLFRSLQNSLNDVKLTSKEARENHLKQFFD